VLDGSETLQDGDFEALRSIPPNVPKIAVVNKSDLPCALGPDDLAGLGIGYCRVSALTGMGLDSLDAEIKKTFPELGTMPSGEVITNTRQAEAISRALAGLSLAIDAIKALVTPDAVLTDIEAALMAVGEVTGDTMREDVISRVFERFCVGK